MQRARPLRGATIRTMSIDTTPEAAAAHLAVLRAASTEQRLRACFGFSRSVIALSRDALRVRHPEMNDDELAVAWVEQNYGRVLADGVRARLAEMACDTTTTSPPR